jgi:hypothetical protein
LFLARWLVGTAKDKSYSRRMPVAYIIKYWEVNMEKGTLLHRYRVIAKQKLSTLSSKRLLRKNKIRPCITLDYQQSIDEPVLLEYGTEFCGDAESLASLSL